MLYLRLLRGKEISEGASRMKFCRYLCPHCQVTGTISIPDDKADFSRLECLHCRKILSVLELQHLRVFIGYIKELEGEDLAAEEAKYKKRLARAQKASQEEMGPMPLVF